MHGYHSPDGLSHRERKPRDGNPLAAYVIYDMPTDTIILKRLSYDIKKAQEKILAAGLPEKCATRLAVAK